MNEHVVTDPLAASDGTCVVDGKRLPKKAVEEGDPFCSTKCCRLYHDIIFSVDTRRKSKTRLGKGTRDLRKSVGGRV